MVEIKIFFCSYHLTAVSGSGVGGLTTTDKWCVVAPVAPVRGHRGQELTVSAMVHCITGTPGPPDHVMICHLSFSLSISTHIDMNDKDQW